MVFPALEGKEGLVNVSQAYTLDHQAEAQLFQDLDQVCFQPGWCSVMHLAASFVMVCLASYGR